MKRRIREKLSTVLHDIFSIGIFIKLIYGILELLGGILLFFIRPKDITGVIRYIFRQELLEDPRDFIANYLMQAAQNLSINARIFFAIFLLIHAFVNIGIYISIKKQKPWAYPAAGAIISLLVLYQVYHVIQTHSMFWLFLTIVDVVIILLLRFEYVRARKAGKGTS